MSPAAIGTLGAGAALLAGIACTVIMWRGPFWRRCVACFIVAWTIGTIAGMIASTAF